MLLKPKELGLVALILSVDGNSATFYVARTQKIRVGSTDTIYVKMGSNVTSYGSLIELLNKFI